jgi:hypothetical protein
MLISDDLILWMLQQHPSLTPDGFNEFAGNKRIKPFLRKHKEIQKAVDWFLQQKPNQQTYETSPGAYVVKDYIGCRSVGSVFLAALICGFPVCPRTGVIGLNRKVFQR